MAILGALLGHAGPIDPGQAQQEYARLLATGEPVLAAYKLVRDLILLTDRRLILIDKQGITGRKTEYMTIPYRSMIRFSVESAGHFDLDAELKIWVSGSAEQIERTFNHKVDVYELQSIIAEHLPR
ncbi:PH domain-containing protein [Pararoseomonas indoligenes]|uniref:PH domain-containing protein n=1 Tax=Roseomonas indoligenes TaxID=2820811 RepID=A0A940N4K9_9PROT|nr:PH domain-containing protein [Pararoseomonas indoligenes]MBP0496509.1 PH domain-containing protein [Pararoseomonas indoligenes]